MIGYLIFILRVLLLSFVLLGYIFFINDKLKLHISFIPIVLFSSITVITYIAGILNYLNLSVQIISIIGLVMLALYSMKIIKGKYNIKFLIHPSILFFLLLSTYFFILMKGMSYLHYDNFSHWATIVKEMFYFNSLPDQRSIITFRNYPPGAAVFIYYICKIIGYSESHSIMAQSLIISSCFATLFCRAKIKNIFYCFYIASISIISICILSYDDTTLNIYNLLVDGLLGYLTVSSIISVNYYKEDIKKLFFTVTPILCILVLIKDSGKVFIGLIISYIIFELFKKIRGKNLYFILGIVGIPLFLDFLWKIYVKIAYPSFSYSSNKFSISYSSLSNSITRKSPEFINGLPLKLLKEVFNFNYLNTKIFIIVNIISICIIIFFFIIHSNVKNISKFFVITNLMTMVYIFTLYILYAMIMNEFEARDLAAFDRYYSSIIIVTTSIQLLSIADMFFKYNKYFANIVGFMFVALIIYLEKGNVTKLFISPNERDFRRHNIQEVCKKARNYVGRGERIFLYNGDKGSKGYCYFVTSYEMLSSYCEISNNDDFKYMTEQTLKKMADCSYILISEERENFLNDIKIFNNVYTDGKIGNIYKIEKSDKRLNLICLDYLK